jgi:hypothetical protein
MKGFWENIDGTIRIQPDANELYSSLSKCQPINEKFVTFLPNEESDSAKVDIAGYWLDASYEHAYFYREKLFQNMFPISLELKNEGEFIIWQKTDEIPYSELYQLMDDSDKAMYGRRSTYICNDAHRYGFSSYIPNN